MHDAETHEPSRPLDPVDSVLAYFYTHVRALTWTWDGTVVEAATDVRGVPTVLRLGRKSGVLIRDGVTEAFGWSRRMPWVDALFATARHLA